MKGRYTKFIMFLLGLMVFQFSLIKIYDKTHKKVENKVLLGKVNGISTMIKEENKKTKEEFKKQKEKEQEIIEQKKQVVVEPSKVVEQPQQPVPVEPPKVSEPQETPQVEEQTNQEQILGTFNFKLTHYGPDCCSTGLTASGYNVRNTIYYPDGQYGNVRIVATCPQIPLYSIVRIRNYKFGGDIIAIAIDRGVGCSVIDLLVDSEATARQYGIQNDVVVEILRNGR